MLLYNLLLLIVYPLLYVVSRLHSRLRINFDLRKNLPDFSAAQGKTHIWFHAASAGEFEQVRAVALSMRQKHKNLFFSFSYFSDSTYRTRKGDAVPDVLFALPFDFPWRMLDLVARMQPHALIIAKYDAWPNQVRAAASAGVPVYLVSATLPAASRRHRFPLRYFLRSTYAAMRTIFAVNAEHAQRLRAISSANVQISGDTRFDAIAARLRENRDKAKQLIAITAGTRNAVTIVAGSTYAPSEEMLVTYVAKKKIVAGKKLKLVLAPHHLKPQNLDRLESRCLALGLKSVRLSNLSRESWDVCIIDGFGLLAYLYPLCDLAYVGGGFEGSVHSVIEAAVAGVPVITGPAIANSAEALELHSLQLLQILPAPDAAAFAGCVDYVWKNRTAIGKKTAAYFRERLGVSNEIMHTVMDDISEKKERV